MVVDGFASDMVVRLVEVTTAPSGLVVVNTTLVVAPFSAVRPVPRTEDNDKDKDAS